MIERIPSAGLSRTDFHEAIRRNERNTAWLSLIMVLVGSLFGYGVGWAAELYVISQQTAYQGQSFNTQDLLFQVSPWGITGAGIMLVASGLWIVIALTKGDKIVLAMAGAKEVSYEEETQFHNVVEEMALAAGLPKPRVAVMDSPAINAFATGVKPERSAIAVTRGLLDKLNRQELQGVVAHEMSHIANNDVLYMTAVSVVVGLIALLSDAGLRVFSRTRYRTRVTSSRSKSKGGGALALIALVILAVCFIVAPLAAKLVQSAVSRQREYLADATAVKLTRNPLGLIAALDKIDNTQERFKGANRAIQHLFIANPFRKFGNKAGALFSTHPPTPDRIARLRDLG